MKRLLLLLILLFNLQGNSQAIDPALTDSIDALIEQFVEGLAPGVAVGVVQNGKVIYEKYLGYSNLEHQVAVNENTRFNIASNCKQFTALCILKLQEEGKLQLNDDFRKFLPDLYPDIKDPIRISNLITHTSGIRDVYGLWGVHGDDWWELFVDNDDIMDVLKRQRTLNFKPRTKRIYSNSNYILLAAIVEKITGTPLDEYAKKLFESWGMPNSDFLSKRFAVMPNKSKAYANWGNEWQEYFVAGAMYGDGALFTTLKDQMQWEVIVQNNSGKYLSKTFVEASQKPIEGSGTDAYGFGLEFTEYKNTPCFYHDGATGAFHANFLRFPEYSTSIVVMTNNDRVPVNYISTAITNLLLPLEGEPKTYPNGPKRTTRGIKNADILGSYQDVRDNGTLITITEQNDTLYREIYQRTPAVLTKEKSGLYSYSINDSKLKMAFEKEKGEVSALTIFLASQRPNTYKRLPAFDLNEAYKQSLNGSFYNDETQTTISIRYEAGDTYIIDKNGRERKAQIIYKDFLRMRQYKIRLVRDEAGKVKHLSVDRGDRIRNLIFEPVK